MARLKTPESSERVIYSREQAASVLGGVSVSTVMRLEKAGRLTPVRLTGKKNGQVFYKAEEVLSLIEGDAKPQSRKAG